MLFQTNCRGSIMTGRTEHIPPNFRRVVTGHDASGKPVIWIDGNASNHKFPSDNNPLDADVVDGRKSNANVE